MASQVSEFQYLDDSLVPKIGRAQKSSGWFVKSQDGSEVGPFEFLTYRGTDNNNWTIGLHFVQGPISSVLTGVKHRERDKNRNDIDNTRPTFQVFDWNHKEAAMEYVGTAADDDTILFKIK